MRERVLRLHPALVLEAQTELGTRLHQREVVALRVLGDRLERPVRLLELPGRDAIRASSRLSSSRGQIARVVR